MTISPIDTITTGEAAEILEVKRRSIGNYVRSGKLTPIGQRGTPRSGGRPEWLFNREHVARLRSKRKEKEQAIHEMILRGKIPPSDVCKILNVTRGGVASLVHRKVLVPVLGPGRKGQLPWRWFDRAEVERLARGRDLKPDEMTSAEVSDTLSLPTGRVHALARAGILHCERIRPPLMVPGTKHRPQLVFNRIQIERLKERIVEFMARPGAAELLLRQIKRRRTRAHRSRAVVSRRGRRVLERRASSRQAPTPAYDQKSERASSL